VLAHRLDERARQLEVVPREDDDGKLGYRGVGHGAPASGRHDERSRPNIVSRRSTSSRKYVYISQYRSPVTDRFGGVVLAGVCRLKRTSASSGGSKPGVPPTWRSA